MDISIKDFVKGLKWTNDLQGETEVLKVTNVDGMAYRLQRRGKDGNIVKEWWARADDAIREYKIDLPKVEEEIVQIVPRKKVREGALEEWLETMTPLQAGKARKTMMKMLYFTHCEPKPRFKLIEEIFESGIHGRKNVTFEAKPTREERWSGDRRTREGWSLDGWEDKTVTETGYKYFEWLLENFGQT